jgi:predicted transcriptional regulator
MHPDALNAVCAAASTPSLRILRALNLLQVPQRPEEIAEGLELCLSIVTCALSRLEEAGIVRTVHGEIQLAVDLSSFFGEPLTPSTTESMSQPGRKAIHV